jgi:AraC-like DNA-binding protein
MQLNIQRMVRLLQQILETSKSDAGQLSLMVAYGDVMKYICQTAECLGPLIAKKDMKFTITCQPESMMGWIDTDKIDKVLLLIISDMAGNATTGGKITIDVDTDQNYSRVFIRIRDNGQEISSMGYHIAYQLVQFHQGHMINKHYEGQGNTISIELPITRDSFYKAQAAEEQASAFHIPENIELHVPTIDLPAGYEDVENPLGAIIQQAYVSADQEYLQRAIQCVNEHIMDSDYDREAFAADMGSSVSTLYNKIRAITGKNITNFVRDIRIKKACRLAKENPDLRVSDIAYQVGFRDPKYFATSFKRVMGVQPKEYISQQKSEDH